MCYAEKIPGGHQHEAGIGDEEWEVHTGHEDVLKVPPVRQR